MNMHRSLHFFKDSVHIAVKDLKDFARDRARIISFLIMPIFMLLLTGFIFPSQSSLKNIPFGLLDQDGGQVSDAIIEQLKDLKPAGSSTPILLLKPVTGEDQVKEMIRKRQLSGAIIFPEGFSDAALSGQAQPIEIVMDESNPQMESMMGVQLEQAMRDGIAGMAPEISQRLQEILGIEMPPQIVAAFVNPKNVVIVGVVPGKPNYFEFVAPGIMAMVTMMAVMMGLAGSVAREKEQGTLDGLLVSPVSRVSIIMGKTEAQTVRGLIQGGIILILSMTVFGVTVNGSFLLMVLILILGIFSFVGLGILISAAVEEQETAMTIMMTITFPMMFLSGAFFPLQQMPGAVQAISKAIPLTYEVEGLRQVMVLGAGIGDVMRQLLALIIFGAVTLAISIPAFKRVVVR
jgi:ABC-2 type transport system permease protein